MKNDEMVRRVDDLGRIIIPKEVRKKLGIEEGDPLEISVIGDTITLKKYQLTGSELIQKIITETIEFLESESENLSAPSDLMINKLIDALDELDNIE